MSIRDLPPDQLLARALRLVEMGRLDTAHKVLRLAALKAPADTRISSTLAQVEAALAATEALNDNDEDAELDALFEQAQAKADAGELDVAARMLQVLMAARPTDKAVRELHDSVRSRKAGKQRRDVGLDLYSKEKLAAHLSAKDWGGAEGLLRDRLHEHRDSAELHLRLALVLLHGQGNAKAAVLHAREAASFAPDRLDAQLTLAQSLRAVGDKAASKKANEGAKRLAADQGANLGALRIQLASPFQDSGKISEDVVSTVQVKPPSRARMWRIGALAVSLVALAAVGTYTWSSLQPTPVEVEPFREIVPVLAAMELPQNKELKLVVSETDWGTLDAIAQEAALTQLFDLANQGGFRVVFVAGEDGAILGSARRGLVWVPKKAAEARARRQAAADDDAAKVAATPPAEDPVDGEP